MLRRVLAFPLVRIVLAAASIVAVAIAIAVVARALHVDGAIAQAITGFAALALYALYVRRVERRRLTELAGGGAVAEVARGVALGAALFTATIAVLCLAGVATIDAGDGWRPLAAMAAGALGAALTEELVFRAILFRILEGSLGTWIALAISAVLFGVLHAFNPGATLISTAAIALEAGILLAAAFAVTRRLWMPFGLHFAWNFTEGGVFGASVSGGSTQGLFASHLHGARLLTGGAFGPEASIVAVAVCLCAAIALLTVAARRGRVVLPFWRRAQIPSS